MADRTRIKHGELGLFRDWILSTGNFVEEKPKGIYEVARFRFIGKKNKNVVYCSQSAPLMIFDRESGGCGYTIQGNYQHSGIFDDFTKYKESLDLSYDELFNNYIKEKKEYLEKVRQDGRKTELYKYF